MTRARLVIALFASTGLGLAACATGTLPPDIFTSADAGPDVTGADAADCPQFDLQTDPKHCGSCTKACAATEVCSLGVCKNQCDPPTVKCAGAQSCSDLTKDPKNCGQCATACGGPDAGPDSGTGNPDAGIPLADGGLDAGTGWSFGAPGCDAGKCDLTCGAGTSLCSDSLCWDPQNAHDHCGNCGTACAPDVEWCTKGHCCGTGKDYCGGACADLLGDPNNCGSCGNKCGVSTPVCSNGVCSTAITYSQSIPSGSLSASSAQCVAWHTFLGKLTGTYSSITLKGSNDPVGRTCTGAAANQLCQSLYSGSVNPNAPTYVASVSCDGHTWSTGNCAVTGKEIGLSVDATACECKNPGYIARPCIGNENWGGINTVTCSSPNPPAQTLTVECK